jgi:hypothetical protein
MMTILAMVNAEKEGQIESKIMKARQLEEIREAKRKEAEAKQRDRKSKLVRIIEAFPSPSSLSSLYYSLLTGWGYRSVSKTSCAERKSTRAQRMLQTRRQMARKPTSLLQRPGGNANLFRLLRKLYL